MTPKFEQRVLKQERFLNGIVRTVTDSQPKMYVYSKLSKDGTKWFHEACHIDFKDHLIDTVMGKYEKEI